MTQVKNENRSWHLIDLKNGPTYGRALSHAANLLCGKGKTNYAANLDQGDYVVIVNASEAKFTGQKLDKKQYFKHTGYLGNLKTASLKEVLNKNPMNMVRHSISGMLPKNKLRDGRLARLKVYAGPTHPHQNVKFKESNVK